MQTKIYLSRAYLSDKLNFILIGLKRAKIQRREINRELWRKNGCNVTVTLTFDPRSPISIGFELLQLATIKRRLRQNQCSGLIGICSQTDRQTDRHTHTQINWSKKKNPSTILWRCKKVHFDNTTFEDGNYNNGKLTLNDLKPLKLGSGEEREVEINFVT